MHNRSGADDLDTGSRQIRSPRQPSRSSSQSVSTPPESVSTEPGQARGSSPYRSKRIRGRRAVSPYTRYGYLWRGISSSARRRATGYRLHLLSIGDGVPTLFKYPSVGSTRTGQKWLCRRRPEIHNVRTGAHLRLSKVGVCARDKRQATLTLPHPASPGSRGASVKAAWRG